MIVQSNVKWNIQSAFWIDGDFLLWSPNSFINKQNEKEEEEVLHKLESTNKIHLFVNEYIGWKRENTIDNLIKCFKFSFIVYEKKAYTKKPPGRELFFSRCFLETT